MEFYMDRSSILRKIVLIVALIISVAIYLYVRPFIDPLLKQLDKNSSGLEINLLASIIFLSVPSLAIVIYFITYTMIDRYWFPKKLIFDSIAKIQVILLQAEPKWGPSLT